MTQELSNNLTFKYELWSDALHFVVESFPFQLIKKRQFLSYTNLPFVFIETQLIYP